MVASCAPPTADLTCNPGMCPDQESMTRNQTSDLFVHRPALNPLSHTSWGREGKVFTRVQSQIPEPHPRLTESQCSGYGFFGICIKKKVFRRFLCEFKLDNLFRVCVKFFSVEVKRTEPSQCCHFFKYYLTGKTISMTEYLNFF